MNSQKETWIHNPAFWFMLPATVVFLVLGVYPTLQAFWTSLLAYNLTNPTATKFIGLGNYIHLFTDGRFWLSMVRSIQFVVASVSASFIIGFLIALLLSKIKRLQTFYQLGLMVPMVISPTVASYNFKLMYNYTFGIIDHILTQLHLHAIDFLGNTSTALWSTVIIDIWQWTPLSILIMLSGIETIPREIYEAAFVDGARPLRIFFSLTVPLLRPFMVIVILIRLMDSLKVYEAVQLVTVGGPGTSSETFNIYLSTVGFNWFDMGYGTAIGFIALNFTALFCTILVKYTKTFQTGTGAVR